MPQKRLAGGGKGEQMTLEVIKNRCPQNHRCPAIAACPFEALKQEGFAAPTVDEEICTKCGKCTRRCPMGALVLNKDS